MPERYDMLPQVKAHFRPEFVNRVDDFVVFEALKLNEIKQIVRLQAKRVEDRLKDKKMRLELTDSAVDYLAVSPPLRYVTPCASGGQAKLEKPALPGRDGRQLASCACTCFDCLTPILPSMFTAAAQVENG